MENGIILDLNQVVISINFGATTTVVFIHVYLFIYMIINGKWYYFGFESSRN